LTDKSNENRNNVGKTSRRACGEKISVTVFAPVTLKVTTCECVPLFFVSCTPQIHTNSKPMSAANKGNPVPAQQRQDDPLQFFPLTHANIRHNLPKIIEQMFTYDLQSLKPYGRMMQRLYARNASFDYPLAHLRGRHNVCQFWHSFLIGRAFQRNNVHTLHVDMIWDAERLQAFVQVRRATLAASRIPGTWVPGASRRFWLQCRISYACCAAVVPPAAGGLAAHRSSGVGGQSHWHA
jgi:hypothetical protein